MRIRLTQAFSLLEVILSVVVFTLAAAGFFAVLTSARQPVASTDKGLRAAQVGRQVLEDLRKDLGEDTWMQDKYNPGLNPHESSYTDPATGAVFNITYNVEQSIAGDPLSPKKIRLKVKW